MKIKNTQKLFLITALFIFVPSMSHAEISDTVSSEEKSDKIVSLEEKIKAEGPSEKRQTIVSQSEWDAYPIHPGDKIKIVVHGEKELSDTYSVDPQGYVYFPLVEKIYAGGMSLNRFRDTLRAALAKDFLTNPQVEMTFEESIFNSVTILGQVNRPGNFILPPKMTFLRMISIAGGFGPSASFSAVKLIRTNPDGEKTSSLINVEDILDGKVADVELKPGDVVFISKTSTSLDQNEDYLNSAAVLGQVAKPGNYKITSGMTVVRVLSQAGGLLKGSDPTQITLTHKEMDGKQKITTLSMAKMLDGSSADPLIEAGDVLYIPGSSFSQDRVDLGRSVTILGQVQRPSNYDFVSGITLIQLISEAGGFLPTANSAHVRITRIKSDGSKKTFEINANAIIDGKISDTKLELGDIVYVPESVF